MEASPEVTGPPPSSPSASVSWSFVQDYGKGVPASPQSEVTLMSTDHSRAGRGEGSGSLEYSGDGESERVRVDVGESREGRLRGLMSFLDRAEGSDVGCGAASGGRSYGGEVGLQDYGDEGEDDDGEDSWKQPSTSRTTPASALSNAGPLIRQSVAPGKKWLWDEWNDEDYDDISSAAASSKMSTLQPPSTRGEKANFGRLKNKVKAMKREMEERRQEVKALKAKLARRKISDERVCLQIEESWKERLNKRMHEHKSGMERQSAFIEQVSTSNKMLEDRMNGQLEVLQYKESNLPVEIDIAKRGVKEELSIAREEWLGSEKLRLHKLADAKSTELKKDAVKALEPELHRLISGNKLDLKQRKSDMEDQYERFKEEKMKELENVLKAEATRLDVESDTEAEALRKKQSSSMMELAGMQDDDLKDARDKWKSDMEKERESFENERRRRVATYNNELEELRQMEMKAIEKEVLAHENAMVGLREEKERRLKERREVGEEQLRSWQRSQLRDIQGEIERNFRKTEAAIKEQSEAEFEMVLAKLEAQAADERGALESHAETELESFKQVLTEGEAREKEAEQVIMDRYALDHEKAQILQEEVSVLESRVVGMERRVAESEENLKDEKTKLLEVRKDVEARVRELKKGNSRGVELQEKEIENLTKQLGDLETTEMDMPPIHTAECARVEKRYKSELESVEDRVKEVIKRKNDAIKAMENELKNMEEKAEELGRVLDKERKADLRGSGEMSLK